MSDLDNVEEELRIARALRDSTFAERDAILRLSPAQQQKLFARIEEILDLLEKLERLKLQRAAILRARKLQ
jgi:hypothetical protein